MQRKLVLLGVAGLVLVGASLALVARFTAEGPERLAAPPPEAPPALAEAAPAPPPASPPPAAPPPPEVPERPVNPGPPPPAKPKGVDALRPPPSWMKGATPSLATTRDASPLGKLRPYLATGMRRLQAQVALCAGEEPKGLNGAPAPTLPLGRTELTLELEQLDNQFRIAEVVPPSPEAAADWRVQCAQRKLRGQLIAAPVSRTTERLPLPFVLDL